ncbi:LysR family transcriptional regulator [Burkholderia thailandensis]|uniref:Transcriptional regulator, LysR family n=1 Tax=Burkholderia thailandensis (strain ATCC 700388 / DSM 13276 / CCUG 48851 / CIP 106301 / E264) TaxID=271848 RepID=Q2T5A0_BURTA|nr:LysR family transcriptional regulator [Burkholderia thailandensis]ABC36238.1 transcriptional regulator, LysR family [Burkholderia thailandensis E264]AHI76236.1 bacterial regulatory helix-turn-helix, lysR family protein [Burkholderia thailandensis 2002721723]AHI80569.1 bacterial regulatory helix-turn-helix, lysR family protein [Burkholderia thailandensis E444]AIC89599.1 bacterial regulatory helix-turn-helix, lysR family protein [Burkholderia thailandensis USAMRU Malaysia \
MRFDLTDLRLFLHVCEAGSITGGAERAHMTLQSASERIRGMEEELGVPLLQRAKRGTRATEAGRALEHHARVVLQQIDHMRGELQQFGAGLRGHIRLLSNTAALSEYLPDALAEYLPRHPKLSVSVEERSSQEIVHAIRGKTADFGIVADSVGLDGLEQMPFREDWLIAVAALDHPLAARERVAFSELVDADFIGMTDGSALQVHLADQAKALGKRIDYRVQLKSFDAICRLIARGVGIGIVSRHAALRAQQTMQIRLIELTDPWAHRRLTICARAFDELPKYTREFIAFLAHDPGKDESFAA